MSGRLQNKVCLITGGASGIGRATTLRFLEEGGTVVIVDRNSAAIKETLEIARAVSPKVESIEADVSKLDQVKNMIRSAVDRFGQLDVLVNGAGVLVLTQEAEHVEEREWDLIMNTNLKGLFFCCKYALPEMVKGGGGSIVNIASITGIQGYSRSVPYSISKAAVIHLTFVLANQYTARGVRVNAVAPGSIDTPQARGSSQSVNALESVAQYHPMKRIGRADEMAEVILFLASEEASFISGETILADGGSWARGRPV
jgi:NAD(P)-dependent dehydrogenase (short-subunit alcohol dehydrogenase family)